MFSNNPYIAQKGSKNYNVKLPSVSDIIKDGIETSKHTEWKEDQTPLFWSLSHILSELPLIGDKIIQNSGYINNTHTNLFVSPTGEIPRIGIPDYLVRLVKFSPCSKECFIMIIVYIDRIISKSQFIVNSYNIHRLLITAIMVASKYIDDIFYNNEYYSHIGGVSRDELNKLEIDFLTLLEFDVSCPLNEYLDYFGLLDTFVNHIRQQRQKQQMMMLNNQQSYNFSCSSSPSSMMSPPSSTTSIHHHATSRSTMHVSRSSHKSITHMPTSTYSTIIQQQTNQHHHSHHHNPSQQLQQIHNQQQPQPQPIQTEQAVPNNTNNNNIISTRRKSLRDQSQNFFPLPSGVPTCIS